MKVRLLFVGDVHLGRLPSHLPKTLQERGLQVGDLSAAAAWDNTLRWALQNRVDGVVLAGNVVASVEDLFEAYGDLAQGVRQLGKEGIPVYAVAGSEDVAALPLLAERLPEFKLLGKGGEWEFAELTTESGDTVRLLGWSFPETEVTTNPLATLPKLDGNGAPVIGVMSADLHGGEGSTKAPVQRAALEKAKVDGWLLGQQSEPDALSAPRPIGYLGGIVPHEPTEAGRRGPWLVTIAGRGEVEIDPVPLAPVRYETAVLRLETESGGEGWSVELENQVHACLRSIVERVKDEVGSARAVGCALRVEGEVRLHREVRELLASDAIQRAYVEHDGVPFFIERIADETTPSLDLTELSEGNDPIALLARRLHALKEGSDETAALLEHTSNALEEITTNAMWSGLDEETLAFDARELLIEAGTRALEDMLAQRAAASEEVNQ